MYFADPPRVASVNESPITNTFAGHAIGAVPSGLVPSWPCAGTVAVMIAVSERAAVSTVNVMIEKSIDDRQLMHWKIVADLIERHSRGPPGLAARNRVIFVRCHSAD